MSIWLPQRRRDVLAEGLPDGSTVLYDPRAETVYAINVTAAHVWEACDGCRPIPDLVAGVTRSFETSADSADRDIRAFLDDLASRGLLEPEPAARGGLG